MGWEALIAAGVQVASGMLEEEGKEDAREQSRENLVLELQDNERSRAAAEERARIAAQTSLEAARLNAATSKENTRKRILGNALLDKGKDEGKAMMADQQSSANKKERFNDAANNLAAILAR